MSTIDQTASSYNIYSYVSNSFFSFNFVGISNKNVIPLYMLFIISEFSSFDRSISTMMLKAFKFPIKCLLNNCTTYSILNSKIIYNT